MFLYVKSGFKRVLEVLDTLNRGTFAPNALPNMPPHRLLIPISEKIDCRFC